MATGVQENTREAQLQAAGALIAHLRANPIDARRPPQELAYEFGLSPQFVSAIVQNAEEKAVENVERVLSRRIRFNPAATIRSWSQRMLEMAINRPLIYLGIINLAWFLLFIGITEWVPNKAAIGPVPTRLVGMAGATLLAFLLQMQCYYRRRSPALALKGTGLTYGMMAIGIFVSVIATTSRDRLGVALFSAFVGIIAIAFLAALYGGTAVCAALLGGWVRQRQLERQDRLLTRQQLLERYFALQERLERGSTREQVATFLADSPIARAMSRHPMRVGAIVMVIGTLMQMGSEAALPSGTISNAQPTDPSMALFLLVSVLVFIGESTLAAAIGFYSSGIMRGIMNGLALIGIQYAVMAIPVGSYGPAFFMSSKFFFSLPFTLGQFLVLSAFGGIAGELHRRHLRENDLENNDAVAILSEMLRIQWRLADRTKNICVLVIDAAKSSLMKAQSDPLEVEYSFREYQDWIETTCREFHGKIHSTAGDGAVVAFPDAPSAYAAACKLQATVAKFSATRSRLKMPFQIRIGIHQGQVVGELDDVEFTEVIDIAAHLEAVAGIGGIAISEAAAKDLPDLEFLPMAREVDGQKVFLAMAQPERV
ncbi:MAG: adenylate/guanylate cyclase domain-containing protein [Fimbriimonadaceae bacterium]|nr:adenylate/guanylate cyclase domain-containing protein [Fimbriimonadaceae bacterium]